MLDFIWLNPDIPASGGGHSTFLWPPFYRTGRSPRFLWDCRAYHFVWALGCFVQFLGLPESYHHVFPEALVHVVARRGISFVERVAGKPQRQYRNATRSAVMRDGAGGHGCRLPDSRLFHRLHGARERLLPLLRLFKSVHVLHAGPGAGGQLPDDVCRLGRRGPLFLSADRVFLFAQIGL